MFYKRSGKIRNQKKGKGGVKRYVTSEFRAFRKLVGVGKIT